MKTELLLRETCRHFPRFEAGEVEITPIERGGSERRFYRVRSNAAHSLILVKYNLEHAENRQYVKVAEFLTAHQIRAPRVFFHDEEEGLIWIEDLGEAELWSYRQRNWEVRRAFYESALEEIAKLHRLPDTARDAIGEGVPAGFDAALYLWEQSYFFENCLGRFFGMPEKQRAELSAAPFLLSTAERLASLPRVLVHRDFQSQNIIIRDGQAYLLDFQGMRPGLPEYDLASLLYDPYVDLAPGERKELFELYQRLRGESFRARVGNEEEIFRLCAMQRLMQALGAYGYLGLVKGNKAFLAHIPAALASLRSVTSQIEGTERLHQALLALPASQ